MASLTLNLLDDTILLQLSLSIYDEELKTTCKSSEE